MLDESIQLGLQAASATSLSYATGSAVIAQVAIGDILVGDPSPLAPNGFLRKVVQIDQQATQTLFTTERASLTDAIEKGSLRAHLELKPEDVISTTSHYSGITTQALLDPFKRSFTDEVIFDLDGNEDTTTDQVRASGLLEIQPVLDLDIDIDCCEGIFPPRPYLDSLEFRVGVEQHAELELIAEFEDSLSKEIKLFTHRFKSFKFTIGPVPVWVTPVLTVSIGIDGEIKAVATFTAAQDSNLIGGVAYDNSSGFSNISEAEFSFSDTDADFTGQLKAKAYISAQVDLLLYDALGPFAEVQASLKIDGKIPRDPTWILEGCIEIFAGINSIDVLDDLQFSEKIFETCREIGRADNSPPKVEIVNPSDGAEIQLAVETNLNAIGSDPEDGTNLFCCDYKWESNREGVLATTPGARVSFKELGQHEIKVTITDSKGVSSTDTVTITVVNSAPKVNIIKPLANTTVFRNTAVSFEASSLDINEPDAKLACNQLVWTSSIVKDGLPKTGCQLDLSFTSNGTRTIVLTGTDSQGATGNAKLTITVIDPPANLPPVVNISSPTSGSSINLGDNLSLIGTATDPEGDTPLSFQWTAKLNNASPIVIGNAASISWKPTDSFDFSNEGNYSLELRLSVTDSKGNTASDFVIFQFAIIN